MSTDLARRRALRALGKRLGLKATAGAHWSSLDEALTHDSYAHERAREGGGRSRASNERLEFLGDAVLGAAVADHLFRRHPDASEGMLSRRRAALVSRAALAATAASWDLAPLLRLGKGEAATHGERRPRILAAAAEAVVGAVYLCEGFDAAVRLVAREHLARCADQADADPKTALQELLQARARQAPAYVVTAERGPAHAKTFAVVVRLGVTVLGNGEGPTKKLAEAEAAADALRRLSARPGSGGGARPSISRA